MRRTFVLGIVSLAAACTGGMPASAPSPFLSKHLPRFERASLAGPRAGSEESEGKVTVVKFFAKYCKPCKKTLPEAQAIAAAHPDVAVIGIAEDEYRADAEEMVREFHLSFPVIHDEANAIAGKFRVNELPATFVTDARGNVVWVGGPDQSPGDLESAVDAARAPR